MSFMFYQLIVYASTIMPIGAFLAGLVLGILIAANKVKPTRILGIGYIFASVPILTGSLPQFISRFVGAAVLARLSIALSWTGYICALAFSLCICLYIHKRYGKKLIYIPVMAVPVVGMFASAAVALLLNRTGNPNRLLPIWIALTKEINSFITATVASVAVIVVLYLNRKKEDIVPSLWKMRLIVYVWSVLTFINRTLYYVYTLRAALIKQTRPDPFWLEYAHYNELIFLIINIVGSLIALIVPVYIFVMVCRASHKTENTGG